MGKAISRLIDKASGKRDVRILMLGLDSAGKTTIVFKLKLGETVSTIPTVGFNVQTVEYKRLRFTMWDVGGQTKLRPLWRHYYAGTEALIYVVDSNDTHPKRIETCREVLHHLLQQEELNDCFLLVLANKQDLPGAMSIDKITEALDLKSIRGRDWHIQGCCAKTGEGLFEGLDKVACAIEKKKHKN